MTRMVAALAGICAAVSLAAEDRPPQIRSGVEVVAIDVQVTEPEPPRAPVGELEDVLASAARYLEGYERDIPAVVSEEHYNQRGSTGAGEPMAARRLRSDMLIIADADLGWIGFRDVFEVDGRAIRGRDERLVDLFLKPYADRMAQARRIVAESSRFNLNTGPYVVQRTINMPMTALRFLRRPNQPRSRYTFEGRKTEGGIEVALVSFEEKAKPRLIASEDEAAARGRFWVDPITGRVVRSELSFDTRVDFGPRRRNIDLRSKVSVRYAEEPRFRLWLPVSMDEQYVVEGVLLEGQATYVNFRRFAVDTSSSVKTP
jgi:hypothetical protein